MELKSFSDLAKLADVCRKKGIDTIKISGDCIEFKLLDKPTRKRRIKESKDELPKTENPYSEDDLIAWSTGFEAT